MNRTFFAYHLTHFFGEFGLNSYYTNSNKPAEGDLVYVVSGDKDQAAGGVDYWLEGIFRIHRKQAGSYPLQSLHGERKVFQYRLSMKPVRVPDHRISLANAAWYSRKEIHNYFSSGQNFNLLPTDPDYKTRFDELLAEYGLEREAELDEDFAEIRRTVPDATVRNALTKARIGQGRFRADVTKLWRIGETCTLTGLDIPELLVASHILPWRESTNEERLDPCNGLLLVAHADKLFDRYLLSFRENRGDFVSVLLPRVRSNAGLVGLKDGMLLRASHLGLSQSQRFSRYMAEHLRRFNAVAAGAAPTESR